MKKKNKSWTFLIIAIVVVAATGLGYSVYYFYQSGSAEKGIVVCNPNNPNECLWQDHIHSLVLISIDGVMQDLPTEKGSLSIGHTHEERNVIHWHSSLPYDPVKEEVIDKSPLMIKSSLANIGIALPEGGRLFVRKGNVWQHRPEYGDYVWEDKDLIFIAVDSRTNEEMLDYLYSLQINLPYLGAG